MARILVQTNDYMTVLDEHHVRLADLEDDRSAGSLLTRLGRAVRDADEDPPRRKRMPRRLAVIAATSDYLDVSG